MLLFNSPSDQGLLHISSGKADGMLDVRKCKLAGYRSQKKSVNCDRYD